MKNLRVFCSALGSRIMVGTVCKDGITMKDGAVDVTSDALKAIIEKVQADSKTGEILVTKDGVPQYEISVKKLV